MQTIHRIGVLSLAKLMGGISAAMGLLFGGVFTLISLIGVPFAISEGSGAESLLGLLFGVGAIIVLPLAYGLLAFVQGLIVGALANLAFKLFGGLEVEIS